MLRRLEADYKSDFRAVVFDAKGKTFRDDWYPEYKAHRPPMPEELAVQIAPLHECVTALGWPLLMIDGVEADDVIGTLARAAAAQGVETVISTGDKDLAQLVDPHVRLVNTMTNETLDEAGVLAKFGVAPDRIVDYLALVGDSVDGVPGVAKVGPKTAVKWLEEYGSLDGVVASADKIGGKVGENLRAHLDFLPLGRKLVTVACDVALPQGVTDLAPRAPDRARLVELFSRLGFRTWLREVENGAAPAASTDMGKRGLSPAFEKLGAGDTVAAPASAPDRSGYATILTTAQLDAWLRKIEATQLTALDTETTALDPMQARLVGISFCVAPGEAAYLPLGHWLRRRAGATRTCRCTGEAQALA